ncbi:hypothetical protein Tco_0466022, partial [Tanacetum coccineum]
MEISKADQIALDDALIAPANRLKIGKCNLRLSSDVTSKEATLQVVYDVLKLTPFYKAFQVSLMFQKSICKNSRPLLIFITDLGKTSYDSLRLSQAQILWGMYNNKKVDYAYLLWEDFIYQIENKNTKKGNAMYYPRFTKLVVNFVMDKDPSIPRRNKYYAIASGKIPPKTKRSKKKADTDATTKQKPPTIPKDKKEKKSGKGKQKAKELETISEAVLTEAEQLKIITKRSRKETHSSHASGSGADEGTGVTPGVPDAPDYDSDDDISWKSSDDDQDDDKIDDDEKTQDDEDEDKNDDNENAQDDEDDDKHDDDENAQDDEDEDKNDDDENAQDDEDDDKHEDDENAQDDDDEAQTESEDDDDKDNDNEVEGVEVEGEKSDKDATYVEDQGNEADKDTNAYLEGRDDVMTDVILPQSSSVSSGFVSNMINPNQDTGVDAIFGQHTEATSLIDILVTAIAEPSFFAPTNRPPTPNPLFIQLQQPPILTPATTPSSSLQNLPDFEAVDVAVQLKYDRIQEEAHVENQQFLDSIDEGMKKEAKTSHAVATNLSELELKKILIDKMEANKSINMSDTQRQLYKALVNAYEADKILLDTYGDTVTIKRPRDGADDDQEPSAGTDRGSKKRRSGKEPESTSAPREKATTTAGKTTTGSKTYKQSASQSAPVEETMKCTNVFEAPAHQEFETGVHDEQAEEESVPAIHESVPNWLSNLARRQDPRDSFDELTDTTFDFTAFMMNKLNVKTLTPELLAGPIFELMKGTCKSLTELEYFCEEVYKAITEKLDWINPEGRQYPHDLRKPLPLVP